MSHHNGCQSLTTITKTFSCPNCVKKQRKKRQGKIGKIEIMINKNPTDYNSGNKERTCPVCRQQIRFRYEIAPNGKPKVIFL